MNKTYICLLLTVLSCSFFMASCHKTPKHTSDSLEFDSLCIDEKTHILADTSKPCCSFVLNYTYVKNSTDSISKDSINKILRSEFLGLKYQDMSDEQAVRAYADQYAKEYLEETQPAYVEEMKTFEGDAKDLEHWFTFYSTMNSSVIYCSDNYLAYKMCFSDYTGGAHGMYNTTYLNIDLKNGKKLVLDDLFKTDYSDILTDLILNEMIAENGVTCCEELEELGYGTTGNITYTENFHLDEHGITFLYNPYEIAPYSMGQTSVTVPYQMLGHILDETLPIVQNFI